MCNTKNKFITIIAIVLLAQCCVSINTFDKRSNNNQNAWTDLFTEAKDTWHQCAENITLPMWGCLKSGSLAVFDKITTSEVIPLTDGTRLIRYVNDDDEPENGTPRGTDVQTLSWAEHILYRIGRVISTHTLQMDLNNIFTGRHRHRNQMLPMMLFGITALGVITVPMGFQMLAIVAGKALLLAKMALLLASMNGLKRVASSGIQYGLYHAGPQHSHHSHAYWDRQDENHPRSNEL